MAIMRYYRDHENTNIQVCETTISVSIEDNCLDIPEEICGTVTEDDCKTIYEKTCKTVLEKQCKPVHGNRGYCNDVPKTICNSEAPVKECTQHDRKHCNLVPKPRCLKIPIIVPDRKCQTRLRQRCHPREVQQCLTVYESVCRLLPQLQSDS